MVEKIDIAATREAIRKQYAEYPANGDKVLMFENRAADVIADLSAFLLREVVERQTDLATIMQGLAAIASIPLENLIVNENMDRQKTVIEFANILAGYLMDPSTYVEDTMPLTKREVGDA